MYVLRSRSVGFVALSCALALFSGGVAMGAELDAAGGAAAAPCVDDIGVVSPKAQPTERKLAAACNGGYMGDGDCDLDNNTEECGYDGGDCCECTCASTEEYTCGDNGEYDCVDPKSLCAHVEVGTKTSVSVSANAYDTRGNSAGAGCGSEGCAPALTRDEDSEEEESRWSCAQKIVPDGGLCEITYTFGEPQDIKGAQIAFLNGDLRTRSVEAMVNGVTIGDFDSYPGSTFNSLDIRGDSVITLSLKSIGIEDDDWISLVEVRFLVEP